MSTRLLCHRHLNLMYRVDLFPEICLYSFAILNVWISCVSIVEFSISITFLAWICFRSTTRLFQLSLLLDNLFPSPFSISLIPNFRGKFWFNWFVRPNFCFAMTVYNNSNADENIYRLRTKKLTFNENKTKVLSWVEKIYFIQP